MTCFYILMLINNPDSKQTFLEILSTGYNFTAIALIITTTQPNKLRLTREEAIGLQKVEIT